jgi:peptidoglycan-N-acetylglucosamine deacetylase
MLNFKNTNIIFVCVIALLVWINIKYGLPFYFYALAFIVYSLIVFYGCYYVGSNFFIKIVCSAQTDKKEIAISFDDGPAVEHTAAILNLLKQENVPAIFFCIGNRIAGNEEILKQIKADGHIIGNHSYSHDFWFDMLPEKKMLADLKLMDTEMEKVLGIKPKLFRPPYGVTNPNVKKSIINGGYTPVGWSVRSMDTVIKDETKLLAKINNGIKPGAIFLFHDTSKTTLNSLTTFIQEVKNKGYRIIPLDKLLHLTPYA